MSKPIIFMVDDEPQVLNAIERDLRSHFRGDYRYMKAGSGAEAIEVIQQLKQRNDAVALFISDQRMPEMEGTDFLDQARQFYPDARKVLLTAYADTEAAIQSINSIGLDHYLMKPWDPPDQNLYPVLDDLLSDWLSTVPLPYEGIRVAGTLWSASCHNVKDFLSRNRIPYQWVNIEQDPEIRQLANTLVGDNAGKLPLVLFPDGETLLNPEIRDLANKVGLRTEALHRYYDLIIVGGGPAGLGAAVYAGSEGLSTALIEKAATGGQAGTSSRIENYLGFPKGVSGADLARRATAQAERFGVEILTAREVASVRVEGPYRIVKLADGAELSTKALIIATGVSVRELEQPGIKEFTGAGVYYGAAMTEAANYRDQDVYIVGGANSAGQGAMFFSRYARSVTMLIRRKDLTETMSQYLIEQIESTENIILEGNTEVVEAHGDQQLEEITLCNNLTQEKRKIPAAALFIFIGAAPHTELVSDVVACSEDGFILTGPDLRKDNKFPPGWRLNRDPYLLETNVPGIFAAGDVRYGVVRRVATAVGQGANAVSFVHQYLKTV